MICQNCQTLVADDLIFCTNCGARLFEPKRDAQTVLMDDSGGTKNSVVTPQKSSSNAKWIALIVALLAIPASIFGVYLLMNSQKNQTIAQNANKPKTPAPSATRRANANQNTNANTPNTNTNAANSNSKATAAKPVAKTEIMNERIEIAPGEHYAVPFEVESETAKITGTAKVLDGEKVAGYVYIKEMFDRYFPDPTYKVFSFDDKKTAVVEQTIVKQEYVLVFVNDTEKPMVIEGKFSFE